jgi:polyphosphate kinase 2 (PPK2 family)
VLERKKFRCNYQPPDATIIDAAMRSEASIYGFTYSGAFFKNQEWAALRSKYEATLEEYRRACNRLKTSWSLRGQDPINSPPSNLLTLKEFIRSGHKPKKARKDKRRWKELGKEVKKMSSMVAKYQKQGKAPKRVILYLEGLDCTAKSSTGGLICSALEDCGYVVRTAQHNRPPTQEQRQKPWMDRGRFEYPEDVYEEGERVPEYAALVWDRGPAGDFVYGKLSELDELERMNKYDEFRMYDARCREEGVLFFKLLFVADKDSIASTLGKRLAHKHIVNDLHTWLDANSVEHFREGLEEIECHIDPTDFVAFNMYERNLHVFTEFARNTDKMGPIGPWNVVNTRERHPARMRLLQTFERELKKFSNKDYENAEVRAIHTLMSGKDDPIRPISIWAIIRMLVLLWLLWFYAYITWNVDIRRLLED